MTERPIITLPTLACRAGIDYRTAYNWVERGLIVPGWQRSSGTGIPNLFTERDVDRAIVLRQLRAIGIDLDRLADLRALSNTLDRLSRAIDEHLQGASA